MMQATAQLGPAAVSVAGLCKRFPGVLALDNVDLDFQAGAVTAVLGENGAGKSTMMKILAGLQAPDGGTVHVLGQLVRAFTPNSLLHEFGVALVPQEIALCADRTVAENILLGREGGIIPSRRNMVSAARTLLDEVDADIDPRQRAGSLSIAQQQMVLIVRALARDCEILILDEPTTSLTPHEAGKLFGVLTRLRDRGTTIIYVSHRLPEIFQVSEFIHVLRDGRHVTSFRTTDVDTPTLITSMVGRKLAAVTYERHATSPDVLLDVANLSGPGFDGVSFQVHDGEVVGVAGLPDSGNSALVAALFGARPSTGTVTLVGENLHLRSPRDAMRAGIGYVPAERRSQGLFPDMSVYQNATILDVAGTSRFGILRPGMLRKLAEERLSEYDVRGRATGSIAKLSGGNQQKVIISRWMARNPRLLLLDDPTRGVDVGAKAEIHDRVTAAAKSGTGVLMASSDLPELLRVCDRIVVLARGRVTGIVARADATEEKIMTLATIPIDGTTQPVVPSETRGKSHGYAENQSSAARH